MRLILFVRFLQVVALLGLITGVAQGIIEAIFDPQNGLRPALPTPAVPPTFLQRAEQFMDPVSRTVWRMLGPGILLVLCEIAAILDRRLLTHPDDDL